jgi:hypothetical protein
LPAQRWQLRRTIVITIITTITDRIIPDRAGVGDVAALEHKLGRGACLGDRHAY